MNQPNHSIPFEKWIYLLLAKTQILEEDATELRARANEAETRLDEATATINSHRNLIDNLRVDIQNLQTQNLEYERRFNIIKTQNEQSAARHARATEQDDRHSQCITQIQERLREAGAMARARDTRAASMVVDIQHLQDQVSYILDGRENRQPSQPSQPRQPLSDPTPSRNLGSRNATQRRIPNPRDITSPIGAPTRGNVPNPSAGEVGRLLTTAPASATTVAQSQPAQGPAVRQPASAPQNRTAPAPPAPSQPAPAQQPQAST